MQTITIGQIIEYTNGNLAVYTGKVVSVTGKNIVVLDPTDAAENELYNAGYAVGTCIVFDQIK